MATTTRIGRPRRLPRGATGDPSAEIMAAASALFGEQGVAGTTMSQIAAAAGLQQSSLYYYFRSKEDVLAAILREANVIPLELISRVRAQTATAAVRLHRFVAGDVAALCALPFDINEVHRYATRDRDRFASYWSERRTMRNQLAGVVREGVAAEELRDVDPRLAAMTIVSNDEAVQNWYRHDVRPARDPAAIGRFLADFTVGGLLRDNGSLGAVRAESARQEP